MFDQLRKLLGIHDPYPASKPLVRPQHPMIAHEPKLQDKATFHPLPYIGEDGQPLPMGSPNPSAFAVRPAAQGMQQPYDWEDESVGNYAQGYTQNDLSQGIQGGVVNRGNIPLQGSGLGGFAANLQPTANPRYSLQDLLKRRY